MKTLLLVLMVMISFVTNAYSADKKISHVVLIWVNDGVSDKQISEVINKTSMLSKIAVVQDLKIGKPVPSEKKTVDDSFTFAISMNFEDKKALKQYAIDDIHNEYVKSVLKPILKKIIIYDYK